MLFFAIIAVVVVLAPGSGVVAERFLSPQHLWQSLVGSEGLPSVLYMIGFGVPGLDLGFISYLPDVAYGVI